MKTIKLTQGYEAIVDDEDYEYLSGFKWHVFKTKYTQYAASCIQGSTVYMHRLILGVTNPNIHCDHVDMNGLNNSRDNIRPCSKTENHRNRKKLSSNTSGYKGVNFDKGSNKWQARIKVDGVRIKLGYFDSPEIAYESYKIAAHKYHGEFARVE